MIVHEEAAIGRVCPLSGNTGHLCMLLSVRHPLHPHLPPSIIIILDQLTLALKSGPHDCYWKKKKNQLISVITKRGMKSVSPDTEKKVEINGGSWCKISVK